MATIDTFQGCTCASECREKLEQLARLREENERHLETIRQQQDNSVGISEYAEQVRRERDEARNENGLLRGANQEAAETIALLREENERFRRERGVFLKAGLSNTDALPADGLNMLQIGIEETLVQNARLRAKLDSITHFDCCREAGRAERYKRERDEARANTHRVMPENKLMRQALQALGEQLLVPGNWHPTEAITCRGIVKAAQEIERERDEARALMRASSTLDKREAALMDEVHRLRIESMQQAKLISELREENGRLLGNLKRLYILLDETVDLSRSALEQAREVKQ